MLDEETQPLATSPLVVRSGSKTVVTEHNHHETVNIGLHDDDILSRNLYGIDGNTRDDVNFISSSGGGMNSYVSVNTQVRNWLMRLARASMMPLIAIVILTPLNFFLLPLIGIGVSSSCGNEAALTAAAAAYKTRMHAEQHLHGLHTANGHISAAPAAVRSLTATTAAAAAHALNPKTVSLHEDKLILPVWDGESPMPAALAPPPEQHESLLLQQHQQRLQHPSNPYGLTDHQWEERNERERLVAEYQRKWSKTTQSPEGASFDHAQQQPHDDREAQYVPHNEPSAVTSTTAPFPPHSWPTGHHSLDNEHYPRLIQLPFMEDSATDHPASYGRTPGFYKYQSYVSNTNPNPSNNNNHPNISRPHSSRKRRAVVHATIAEHAVPPHSPSQTVAPSSAAADKTGLVINDLMGSEAFAAAAHRYSQAIRRTIIIDGIIQLLECFFMIGIALCVLQIFVITSQELSGMLQHGTQHGGGGNDYFLSSEVLQIRGPDFDRLLQKCFSPTRALLYFLCTYLALCNFEKLYLLLTHCNSSSILWSVTISIMVVAAITIAAAAIIDEQFRRRLQQQASAVAAKSSTFLSAARDRYHQFSNSNQHQHLHSGGSGAEMNSGINSYVRRYEGRQQPGGQQMMGFDNTSGSALLP